MSTKQVVSFFGLGLMGEPMTEHLCKAGFQVVVWNRTISKCEKLKNKYPEAITIASNPKEAIEKSQKYVFCMLFDYNSIIQVFDFKSLKNKILVQMSTISTNQSKELCKLVEENGGTFIECPVLGTNTVAQKGKLQLLVGCSKEEYDQLLKDEVLTPFGTPFYIGQKPKAIQMKLTMNLLVGSLTGVFANALGMLQKNDLPTSTFLEILRNSAFYFPYIDLKMPRMIERQYDDPNFTTTGLLKDFNCIHDEANQIGVYDGIIKSLKELIEKAIKEGYGEKDFSSVYDIFNPPKKE